MKNLIYLLSLLVISNISAQDSQLFDIEWNLHELDLDSAIIVPPNSSFQASIFFFNEDMEVAHGGCNSAYFSDIIYTDNNIFESIETSIVGLAGECGTTTLNNFITNHYSFYGYDIGFPINPFNYELTEDNDVLTLTITNGNNDIATYRNVPLGLEETSIDTLKIVYDVQNELLTLEGSLIPQTKATIYTLAGQKQQENVLKPNTPLDVKTLSIGVYLITLENDVGQQITQKFVKY